MHKSWMIAAAAAAALGLSACQRDADEKADAGPAAPVAKPQRKAGLWVQTTTVQNLPPQTLRVCTSPDVEASLPWWGRVAQSGACTETKGAQNPDGTWTIAARCEAGAAGVSNITGSGKGDFNSHYEVDLQMITVNAADPQLNGARKISNVFEYKGDCPADWSPGDVEVPGGMRMNYDPNQVQREIAKAQAALKVQQDAERMGLAPAQ